MLALLGAAAGGGLDGRRHAGQVDVGGREQEPARLEAGDEEQVAHEALQALRVAGDDAEELPALLGGRAARRGLLLVATSSR